MGIFENALSRLIDNGERQALSIMGEAQRAFDNFDFDASLDSIIETGKNAFDGFNDLMKNIKDTVSSFKFTVPFNEKKEKFEYEIKDGTLSVTVKGKGVLRSNTTTIPSNCKVDEITFFIDKKNGTLTFTIPKNIVDDENVKKFKDAVTTKANATANWLREAIKERANEVANSTVAPTSKSKRKKPNGKAKPKIVRGADGKFRSAKNS